MDHLEGMQWRCVQQEDGDLSNGDRLQDVILASATEA
jgi:hypothetical protein